MASRQVQVANFVLSLPGLRSPAGRRGLLRTIRRARRARRRVFERRRSDRWSRPALYGMDQRLLDLIGPDGVFVEAGGNDGFDQSNTYWLERFHGWRGVLVEAIPDLYAECRLERPTAHVVNCALVAGDFPEPTVTMRNAGLLSIMPGARGSAEADDEWVAAGTAIKWEIPYEVTVPARTLTSVIEEAGLPRPDLVSLDVEGYEVEVLRGLDLARFGPRYLLVEARDDEARARLDALLAAEYELIDRPSPFDLLYARRADVT